jgi:hypothetical protein
MYNALGTWVRFPARESFLLFFQWPLPRLIRVISTVTKSLNLNLSFTGSLIYKDPIYQFKNIFLLALAVKLKKI